MVSKALERSKYIFRSLLLSPSPSFSSPISLYPSSARSSRSRTVSTRGGTKQPPRGDKSSTNSAASVCRRSACTDCPAPPLSTAPHDVPGDSSGVYPRAITQCRLHTPRPRHTTQHATWTPDRTQTTFAFSIGDHYNVSFISY